MHVMEAIQESPGATLTDIAEMMGITKATASVSVKRLVKKDYVQKTKVTSDKRKSILKLTEHGEFCCKKHRQFHEMMVESLLKDFDIAEYPGLLQSLQSLLGFFNRLGA